MGSTRTYIHNDHYLTTPYTRDFCDVVHHFFLWGSILVLFVFNYVYSAIDTKQRVMDTFFVFQRATYRAEFWFVILLTAVIALIPVWAMNIITLTRVFREYIYPALFAWIE